MKERNLPAMQLLKVFSPHLGTDRFHSEIFGKRLEEMISWNGFANARPAAVVASLQLEFEVRNGLLKKKPPI